MRQKIIPIDRAQPFDPVAFLGQGWKIDEQDERALTLVKVDLSKVRLEHCLEEKEDMILGEERLKRLKALGHIRLDAKVFQTLWENQKLISKKWEKIGLVSCDGTILLDPDGIRRALCLSWDGDVWCRIGAWLKYYWDRGDLSALLEVSPKL